MLIAIRTLNGVQMRVLDTRPIVWQLSIFMLSCLLTSVYVFMSGIHGYMDIENNWCLIFIGHNEQRYIYIRGLILAPIGTRDQVGSS